MGDYQLNCDGWAIAQGRLWRLANASPNLERCSGAAVVMH